MGDRRHRRHLLAITSCLGGGIVLVVVGVVGPQDAVIPAQYLSAPAIVSGVVLGGLGLGELVRVLVGGPQPPGRHTDS